MTLKLSFLFGLALVLAVMTSGCITEDGTPKPACGIENCHGLAITCGSKVPEACTEEYAFGDRCRQFAICKMIDNECRLLKNEKFDTCASCAQRCKDAYQDDITGAFECESRCDSTSISEKYCQQDSDCACGRHKTTGDCFYGNKNYVDTGKQCPDFCTGIAGNLEIRCVNNECIQKIV